METKKNFAGKDGFIWWTGVVEDRKDPLKLGRCRVRCLGWHATNKVELPTNLLPWAVPSIPVNSSVVYPPREGEMVFGFFLDGENAQRPVMLGSFPSIPFEKVNPQQAFSDPRTPDELASAPKKPWDSTTQNYPYRLGEPTTSRLARNDGDSIYEPEIIKQKKENTAKDLRKSPAGLTTMQEVLGDPVHDAVYPYNNVYESESGHVLEFDDTKDAERIHIYHRSGSYVEWVASGSQKENVQGSRSVVVGENDTLYIKGSVGLKIYVDKDVDIKVGNDVNVTVGNDVNVTVERNVSVKAKGTMDFESEGNMSFKAPRIDFNKDS